MLDCYLRDDGTTRPRRSLLSHPAELAGTIPMQWYPLARALPLPDDVGGPLTVSQGLVLHVQEGRGSPRDWFNRADVDASSHFWINADGGVEQYVPCGRVAWTQAAGNASWHSVETAGYHDEPLTSAQLDALAALYRWGHVMWGWPLRLAETPTQTGLGWHGMGGIAWGGHPDCPGDIRRGQRAAVLAHIPEEDTMCPTAEEIATAILARLWTQMRDVAPHINQGDVGDVIGQTYNKTGDLQAKMNRVQVSLDGILRILTAGSPTGAILADDVALAYIASATEPGPIVEVLHATIARLQELAPSLPPPSVPDGAKNA